MNRPFDDVQRIVLRGHPWEFSRHLMISWGDQDPCELIERLCNVAHKVASRTPRRAEVQCSFGFTRRGLERAMVPSHVMSRFVLKAPAFSSGAALRGSQHLGWVGRDAPENWSLAFSHFELDLVLSIHGDEEDAIKAVLEELVGLMPKPCRLLGTLSAASLGPPPGLAGHPVADPSVRAQWVHFDYRDGISRIGIRGWTDEGQSRELGEHAWHAAGEFVLGHPDNSGGVPWVSGPGLSVWPPAVRAFFRNGSFGVLQQIDQDVPAFNTFVTETARAWRDSHGDSRDLDVLEREVKGKLCGRYPEGQPIASPGQRLGQDFDYRNDPNGVACPFGSHVRRMNPRLPPSDNGRGIEASPGPAHSERRRPLLRRGMPYGTRAPVPPQHPPGAMDQDATTNGGSLRGLLGHFFCASIEDQFEHLLGQWADRVPLGSPDQGGARDPLIGNHGPGDGPFEVPQESVPPRWVKGFVPFVRTVGAAYLFYPSWSTMKGIAHRSSWLECEDWS